MFYFLFFHRGWRIWGLIFKNSAHNLFLGQTETIIMQFANVLAWVTAFFPKHCWVTLLVSTVYIKCNYTCIAQDPVLTQCSVHFTPWQTCLNTISLSFGRIQPYSNYYTKTICLQISTTVYCQICIKSVRPGWTNSLKVQMVAIS